MSKRYIVIKQLQCFTNQEDYDFESHQYHQFGLCGCVSLCTSCHDESDDFMTSNSSNPEFLQCFTVKFAIKIAHNRGSIQYLRDTISTILFNLVFDLHSNLGFEDVDCKDDAKITVLLTQLTIRTCNSWKNPKTRALERCTWLCPLLGARPLSFQFWMPYCRW